MDKQYTLHLDFNPGWDAGLPPVTVVQRKRQRTMRIRIKNDAIVVSGPASVSQKRLLRFVEEKQEWIRKSCRRQLERAEKLATLRKQTDGTLLLRGIRKPVHDFPVPGLRKPRLVEHDHAVVYQFNPSSEPDGPSPVPDPDLVASFYRTVARQELLNRYKYWSEQLPFRPSRLTIRSQRTKWGSCSSRGTISLNWRLVKCPAFIMDYIVIHELCHLRHFDHSRSFWETVRTYYPGVREAKKWIRENSDEIFADF